VRVYVGADGDVRGRAAGHLARGSEQGWSVRHGLCLARRVPATACIVAVPRAQPHQHRFPCRCTPIANQSMRLKAEMKATSEGTGQ
jgi:hypothetical protein